MDRPNVLVIMSDQQKATASHLYGNSFCQTPSMQRLAEDGVLFDHAITPHPLCMPARVSFWASQFPHTHGGRRNQTPMPAGVEHAWKIWKNAGYTTGLIGKNHCFERTEDRRLFDVWNTFTHGGQSEGLDMWGMDWFRPAAGRRKVAECIRAMPFQTPSFAYGANDLPLEDHSTGLIAGQTVRFLEQYREDPFALWVSLPDPHEPWMAPRQYASMFTRDKIELPPQRDDEFGDGTAPERNKVLHNILNWRDDDIEDVYGVMGAYYGMVRFLDDGLGQILDALERLQLRDNTIVVFCSDHGDFMGEHGMTCKGGVFYDCLTRVPLIVSWPGQVSSGLRDASMVNLIDVMPTLLQLQGLDVPRAMQGACLPTVTDAVPRDATFSEYGSGGPAFTQDDLNLLPQPWGRSALMCSLQWREAEGRRKMVRTKSWKYVHDSQGDTDELYDLCADPWELRNVVDQVDHAAVLAGLRLRLADWSIDTEGSQPVPLPEDEHYRIN